MVLANEQDQVLGNLVRAVHLLEEAPGIAWLMPEVRINLVYALSTAECPRDVAGIEGRITVVKGCFRAAGYPAFGASDHMARCLIEVRKYAPRWRAGMNFRWDPDLVKQVENYCKNKSLTLGKIERSLEPREIQEKDGSSMPWKIAQLAQGARFPEIFYESPGWGKEPLFVILGEDAVACVKKFLDLARALSGSC